MSSAATISRHTSATAKDMYLIRTTYSGAYPCSMPPDWTYRSRCLRVAPCALEAACLGWTLRICWRTWRTCFLPIPPLDGECIRRWVGDAPALNLRPRCQGVSRRLGATDDVPHLDASDGEGVGDERAMAAPWHSLGAHDRFPFPACRGR